MTSLELLKKTVQTLDDKKAKDIKVIKISDISILCDYFVIATGTSSTQVKALADEVEFRLSQLGSSPLRREGYQSASWVLLDYGEVIVHIFYGDTREFYQLENLWSDGDPVDVKTLL